MLNEVAKVKVKGGIFEEATTLPFFEKEKKSGDNKGEKYRANGAILYGRNGSGKSTISNAFLAIRDGGMSEIEDAQVLDLNNASVILNEDEKKHIYVFNEDFIDKKVKIDKSGMDAIVMLGPSIGKEVELDKAKEDLKDAEIELEKALKATEKFQIKKGDDNPETYKDNIKEELKKQDGWVDREKKFGESGRVTESAIDEIVKLSVSETRLELDNSFSQELTNYNAAKTGESRIDGYIPNLQLSYDEVAISSLLSKKVEKPELTDRERWLIDLSVDEVLQRKKTFEREETTFCPYCGRGVDSNFKTELITSFNKKLSKDVEEHVKKLREKKNEVEKIKTEISKLQLDNFKSLPEHSDCISLIEKINNLVGEILNQLDSKEHDPHTPIELHPTDMNKLLSDLSNALDKLKTEKEEHNNKVTDIDSIVDRLKSINKKIAYYEVKSIYDNYKKKETERDNASEDYKKKEQTRNKCKFEKERLEKEKEALKPDIAVGIINEYLEYIFVSDERLKIIYDDYDKSYKLYSRGNRIDPKHASIGERNIIALCYFFASILEKKERSEAVKEEYLFVIDDPISSFDVGNKVGLMSFLRMMIGDYSKGNKNTAFIITTHDIKTSYDLEAIFSEIKETRDKWYFNKFELYDKSLKQFGDKRNEYSELVKIVFNYAKNSTEDPESKVYDIFIGNIMRQVLESYATFTYGLGMSQLTTDKHALLDIPEEYRSYFNNRMYRLLLNGGSHKLEDIKANDDSTYYSKMTTDEKHAVAKDVICLLYKMNPGHLFAHLTGSRADNEQIIRPWVENLPKEIALK